jgi:hypothetical protein
MKQIKNVQRRTTMLSVKSIPLTCAFAITLTVDANVVQPFHTHAIVMAAPVDPESASMIVPSHSQPAATWATPATGRIGPTVLMDVILPDGQTRELRAADSEVAVVTLKDGTEIGLEPVIQNSKPWTLVTIRIFRMATAGMSTQHLGDVTVTTGGPAMESQTIPAFKIAVRQVDES